MKNKTCLRMILCALALCGASAFAQAVEGPWLVRFLALSSSSHGATGNALGPNQTLFELRGSYSFNKNAALTLTMLLPQAHRLSAQDLRLETLPSAPPPLWLHYHFEAPGFKPYVGAGLNFTPFSALKLQGLEGDKSGGGAALQVGVDIPVARNLSVNLDVKKVYMGVDFYQPNGTNFGAFKIDPLLFAVGLGLRF